MVKSCKIWFQSCIASLLPFVFHQWKSNAKYNKASVNFWHFWQCHALFLSPSSSCLFVYFFLVLYWRRLEAQDEEIQMPSLKPSESKNRSQRRFFYTAPQSSSVRSSIYPGSTCNSVYVCVHGRMGTCKARALQRTPPACQWCWQVSGSSSKGCPRSACLEALLWQEAQVIKGGRLRGDDGGW